MSTEMQKRMKALEVKADKALSAVDNLSQLAEQNLSQLAALFTWMDKYLTEEQKVSLAATINANKHSPE